MTKQTCLTFHIPRFLIIFFSFYIIKLRIYVSKWKTNSTKILFADKIKKRKQISPRLAFLVPHFGTMSLTLRLKRSSFPSRTLMLLEWKWRYIYPEEEYGNWQYIPFSKRKTCYSSNVLYTRLDRIDNYYYSKHVFVFIFACFRTSYNPDNVPFYTV